MRIRGTDQDDTLMGTSRADVIRALAGNDTIRGGGGRDEVYGGDGNDTIFVQASGSTNYGEGGDDSFLVEANAGKQSYATQIFGGDGTDVFDRSALPASSPFANESWTFSQAGITVGDFILNDIETLRASAARNVFSFSDYTRPLTIYGNVADDFFYMPSAGSTAYGGDGNDSFRFETNGSVMLGGKGNDLFTFEGFNLSDFTINGGLGVDTVEVYYASKIDLASGQLDANYSHGKIVGVENVTVLSNGENGTGITVYGSADDNTIAYYQSSVQVNFYGRDGDDVLRGSAGSDVLDGGAGDDTLIGGGGTDSLYGGEGIDTVDYSIPGNSIVAQLTDRGIGTIIIQGQTRNYVTDVENVTGSWTADTITGNRANNVLSGAGGNDVLNGKAGDDTLIVYNGATRLTGGTGADVFQFGLGGNDVDLITDFSKAEGDKIALTCDANTVLDGAQHFRRFIGEGEFTGHAGEVRFDHIGKATFVYADTNGDAAADFPIKLTGSVALEAGDFIF